MTSLRNSVLQDTQEGVSHRKKKSLIFVISGPSGSGKTTLVRRLLSSSLKNHLIKSISFTTRAKRKGEREGKDYYFLKKEEFILKRKNKELLEWTEYLGHFYGTEKKTVDNLLRSQKHILLCLDTKGALKIKKLYPENSVLIFILPPSINVLKERLKKRSPEKNFRLTNRLEKARKELRLARNYDYRILNDKIETALKELKEIILYKIKKENGLPTFRKTLR